MVQSMLAVGNVEAAYSLAAEGLRRLQAASVSKSHSQGELESLLVKLLSDLALGTYLKAQLRQKRSWDNVMPSQNRTSRIFCLSVSRYTIKRTSNKANARDIYGQQRRCRAIAIISMQTAFLAMEVCHSSVSLHA